MSCIELYSGEAPLHNKRIRRVDCATAQAAGWPKIGPRFYNSIGGAAAAPPWAAPTLTLTGGALPITGDAGGTKTIVMDIDFGHHDIPAGGKTATITYNVGAGDATATANLAAGMTPIQQTNAIAAAVNGVAELGAVKGAGTTITVTPTDTTVLSKLELAVA